jgi:hypothetical protein
MVCARCGEHVRPGAIELVRGPGAQPAIVP